MPVNTNKLRNIGEKLERAWLDGEVGGGVSLAEIKELRLAASELDALRTERNLTWTAAGAEPKPHGSHDSYYVLPGDEFTGEMKIEAERHGVTTDLLKGLRRLVTGLHEGRPECGGDNGLRYLAGLLIDKERANIRRMLPYDPGG